jgi:cleavage and polyadenylation specificity factor subunit 1
VDPYLAIIRDDSTLLLLQADDSGDLDEVTLSEDVVSQKWLSACFYSDNAGFFTAPFASILFLLNQDHQLYVSVLTLPSYCSLTDQVYRLPDFAVISVIEGVGCLPPILSTEPPKRSTTRENVLQIAVVELGDSYSSLPFLIVSSWQCL